MDNDSTSYSILGLDSATEALVRNAAQQALTMQAASNLTGLLHAAPGIADAISAHARALSLLGTEWRNKHPLMVLFAAQVAHLTGGYYEADDGGYTFAYQWAEHAANS